MKIEFNFFDLSYPEAIIVVIFLGSLIILLYYYLFFYLKFVLHKNTTNPKISHDPVSVIISAHNEDYNLRKNLKLILDQDYPQFEVLVVDHASDDDTEEILKDFKRNYNNLSIITIKQDLNFFKGKKFPLSIGIKSAKYDKLLLTDADCKPVSKNWIRNITSAYNDKTEIVLGYGPYIKKKGLLDKIIRYDTLMIAVQYFSFALRGLTYMGVGRNLSYRKELFFKNKGFISHYGVSSGDDDLFIMQAANKTNVRIETSEDSKMYSEQKPTYSSWFTQKIRHISTSKFYPLRFKILLSLNNLAITGLYLSLVMALITGTLILPITLAFILYSFIRILIQKKAAAKLAEEHLLVFSLFGEIMHLIIMVIIFIRSMLTKKQRWK